MIIALYFGNLWSLIESTKKNDLPALAFHSIVWLVTIILLGPLVSVCDIPSIRDMLCQTDEAKETRITTRNKLDINKTVTLVTVIQRSSMPFKVGQFVIMSPWQKMR